MTEFQPTPLTDIVKRDEQGRFAKREEDPIVEAPASDTPSPALEPAKADPPAAASPSSPTGETPKSEEKPGPSPAPDNEWERKAKGLEAELARLRHQRREPAAQPAPIAPAKPPSVFEDEEGYTNHLTTQFKDDLFQAKLEMSEENARERFPDLSQVMGTIGEGGDMLHVNWIEAVKANPALFDQFKRAADPVRFAYQELKRQAAQKEIGDPVAYKEKLRQELLAELKANGGVQAPAGQGQPVPAKPEPVIPDTLAGSTSKAAREAPEFNGPTPLAAILKSAPHMQRAMNGRR